MAHRPKKFGRRYPWKKWFSAGTTLLEKGKDFDCMLHGMLQMARTAASRLRLSVQVTVPDDEHILLTVKGKLPARAN